MFKKIKNFSNLFAYIKNLFYLCSMNLRDIINRPNGLPVSQEEAVFVVQEYIREIKNVSVEINMMKYFSTLPRHAIHALLQRELTLLFNAYITASNYFITNFK